MLFASYRDQRRSCVIEVSGFLECLIVGRCMVSGCQTGSARSERLLGAVFAEWDEKAARKVESRLFA